MIGTTEALIIGGVVLLLFGAKKLPELAKSMGQSKSAFDEGLKEGRSSDEEELYKSTIYDGEDEDEDDDEGDGGDSGGEDGLHSSAQGGFG
jgi:sec-independent protein translocase protein TatA